MSIRFSLLVCVDSDVGIFLVNQSKGHTVTTPTYEFSDGQNSILKKLSGKMKAVGIILFVIAGLSGLQLLQALAESGNILVPAGMAVIYLLMGLWTWKAGKAYSEIVTTEGSDINHLINAQASLLNLYNLQFWLLIVAVVLSVVAGLLVGLSSTPESTSF